MDADQWVGRGDVWRPAVTRYYLMHPVCQFRDMSDDLNSSRYIFRASARIREAIQRLKRSKKRLLPRDFFRKPAEKHICDERFDLILTVDVQLDGRFFRHFPPPPPEFSEIFVRPSSTMSSERILLGQVNRSTRRIDAENRGSALNNYYIQRAIPRFLDLLSGALGSSKYFNYVVRIAVVKSNIDCRHRETMIRYAIPTRTF